MCVLLKLYTIAICVIYVSIVVGYKYKGLIIHSFQINCNVFNNIFVDSLFCNRDVYSTMNTCDIPLSLSQPIWLNVHV